MFAILRRIHAHPLLMLVIAQGAYLAVGIGLLDFNVGLVDVAAAVITALLTELLFQRTVQRFPLSACAAGLGVAIFFRASNPLYFVLVSFIAIASKYLLRIRGKHIFNPSNFGIVLAVVLLPFATTIEFTQWGSSPAVYGGVALVSFYIAYQAGAILTTISFITSYTALLYLLTSQYSTIFAAHHYGILGPSFVLFACFMITDPKTSPQEPPARVIHGISIALCYFLFEIWGVRYSLFLAAFSVSLLNGLALVVSGTMHTLPATLRLLPKNTVSFGIVAILAVYFGKALFATGTTLGSPVSLPFILFGTESASIQQCGKHPVFVPRKDSGLEKSAWTSGASWGDYDNDGYDDIFVSDMRGGGVLYRNDTRGTFTDVTAQAQLPSIPTASSLFVDYDNNGTQDLFIIPSTKTRSDDAVAIAVYKNTGTGTFVDVTTRVGLAFSSGYAKAGALSFADYNNDGFLDFVYATPAETLFLSPPSYVALEKSVLDPFFPKPIVYLCEKESIAALRPKINQMATAENKYDEVQHFLEQDSLCVAVTHTLSPFNGANVSVKGPITSINLILPGKVSLFENKGGTHFAERADFWNALVAQYPPVSKAFARYEEFPYDHVSWMVWQPVSFDFNGDRLQDIFISIDKGSNLLLANRGNFVFEDVTKKVGMNYAGSGMGADVTDINEDGRPDLIVDNSFDSFLYENNADGTFTNLFHAARGFKTLGTGWGISFLDYNLDGLQDVYVAVGDQNKTTSSFTVNLSRPLFRADKLYKNYGEKVFLEESVDLCPDTLSGKALAVSDYDNNGTPDVFIGNLSPETYGGVLRGSTNKLMHNTTANKNYIEIRLEGRISNRMGIGSSIEVSAGEKKQTKFVLLGNSFYSENSQAIHFGLDDYAGPLDVHVQWPSGVRTNLSNIAPNQILTIEEK